MSIKRILYGVVIGTILLALVMLGMSVSVLKAQTEVLLENSKVLHQRVVSLENKLLETESELSFHKTLTQINFESNWKSIARMNNNFKALGKGFMLEEKDVSPFSYAYKEEETP